MACGVTVWIVGGYTAQGVTTITLVSYKRLVLADTDFSDCIWVFILQGEIFVFILQDWLGWDMCSSYTIEFICGPLFPAGILQQFSRLATVLERLITWCRRKACARADTVVLTRSKRYSTSFSMEICMKAVPDNIWGGCVALAEDPTTNLDTALRLSLCL